MTILTDGVLSDGFQAKIKIWSAGDFLGQVSGMNYLNPAACSIDLPRDRVELQFPGGVAAAHGASHLSTGTDPIPPGTLQISGVTGSFEIPGTLGVGTSPIPGRSLNIKSDGAARIYAENDGTAALEAEIKSSTDPILPNWLVLRGVNTTKTHFQDPGLLLSNYARRWLDRSRQSGDQGLAFDGKRRWLRRRSPTERPSAFFLGWNFSA